MISPAHMFALGIEIERRPLTSVTGAPRSSNITSIGHLADRQVLEVEFAGGAVWRYAPVETDVYNAVFRAESPGRVFYRRVRNRYRSVRVDLDDADALERSPDGLGHAIPIDVPDEEQPRRPPPAQLTRRRHQRRVGVIDNAIDEVYRDERELDVRGADGTVVGSQRCDVCGAELYFSLDDDRRKAGLLRCRSGHISIARSVDVSSLETG